MKTMKRTMFWFVFGAALAGMTGCADGGALPDAPPTPAIFTETWANGSGAWVAPDGKPIEIDTEQGCPAYQHETIQASGGRVVTTASIPVEGGALYCLTAWVRSTNQGTPFLGVTGAPDGIAQWPIGVAGFTSGIPDAVSIGVNTDGQWGWYRAPFTVSPGAQTVELMDENFNAQGAADFAAIQLFKGECPEYTGIQCAAVQ